MAPAPASLPGLHSHILADPPTPGPGIITTVAGTGVPNFGGDGEPAAYASLSYPCAVAADGTGKILIADQANNRLREVGASTSIITTVAGTGPYGYSGDGGPASQAMLNDPCGGAFDQAGDFFFGDAGNHVVREIIAATGVITTVAGTGTYGNGGDGGPAT